jgi:hypothetical protein
MVTPALRTEPSPEPPRQRLAAFDVWLAARDYDDDLHRRYRAVVRAYLQFVAEDYGASGTRGCRFVVAHRRFEEPGISRGALGQLAECEAGPRHRQATRRTTPSSTRW